MSVGEREGRWRAYRCLFVVAAVVRGALAFWSVGQSIGMCMCTLGFFIFFWSSMDVVVAVAVAVAVARQYGTSGSYGMRRKINC